MGILSKIFKGVTNERNNNIDINGEIKGSVYQGVSIENVIIDPASAIRKIGDQEQLKDMTSTIAETISRKHPLYPLYETAVNMDGKSAKFYSKALSPEAKKQYPKMIKAEFAVSNPNGYSMAELQRRAYISQTPIPMRMTKGIMMLGDTIDPYQEEVEKLKKCEYKLMPPELPKPFRVMIMVKGTLDYYDILLRFQSVDPDANVVLLSNAGQVCDVLFSIIYYRDSGKVTFNYQSLAKTWIQIHKFLSFMLAAKTDDHILIKDVENQSDLLDIHLSSPLYGEEYDLLKNDIELIKNIMLIEEKYSIKLNPEKEFTNDDLQIISLLAKSIKGESTVFHWTEISCDGVLKPAIEDLDYIQARNLTFVSTVDVIIQDQEIKGLTSSAEYCNVQFKEPEKIKQSVKNYPQKPIAMKMIPSCEENIGTVIIK